MPVDQLTREILGEKEDWFRGRSRDRGGEDYEKDISPGEEERIFSAQRKRKSHNHSNLGSQEKGPPVEVSETKKSEIKNWRADLGEYLSGDKREIEDSKLRYDFKRYLRSYGIKYVSELNDLFKKDETRFKVPVSDEDEKVLFDEYIIGSFADWKKDQPKPTYELKIKEEERAKLSPEEERELGKFLDIWKTGETAEVTLDVNQKKIDQIGLIDSEGNSASIPLEMALKVIDGLEVFEYSESGISGFRLGARGEFLTPKTNPADAKRILSQAAIDGNTLGDEFTVRMNESDKFVLTLNEEKLENKALPIEIEQIKKFLKIFPNAATLSVNVGKENGVPVIKTIGVKDANGEQAFFPAHLWRTCVANCRPYMIPDIRTTEDGKVTRNYRVFGLIFSYPEGNFQFLIPDTYSEVARDVFSRLELNGERLPKNFELMGDLRKRPVPSVIKS